MVLVSGLERYIGGESGSMRGKASEEMLHDKCVVFFFNKP